MSFREIVDALTAAADAAGRVREVLWQAGGEQLRDLLGVLGEVACRVEAAEVAVVAEAIVRGEPASGPVPLATADWVSAYSTHFPTRAAAARTVQLADAIAGSALPDCFRDAVLDGSASVPAAAVAMTEMRRLIPDVQPGFVAAGWEHYTALACAGDVTQVRRLRPWLIATYGGPDQLADQEDRARARATLSRGTSDGGELTDYRLTLDPQSVAEFEAALGPLSAPLATADGEPDGRSWATRRAHALMELLRRGVTADRSVIGRGSTHTTLVVTAADLASGMPPGSAGGSACGSGTAAGMGCGAARTVGSLDAGRFLSIETARAMTCNGSVTPVVVDEHGNPVAVGRRQRLFSPAQVQAVIVRDVGCTFPGCTRPADWTDAHHLIHWADGGPSTIENAALLCTMHHTTVHRRRLAGRIQTGPPGAVDEPRLRVTWDLTPGSYDILLATLRAGPDAPDPVWTQGAPDG